MLWGEWHEKIKIRRVPFSRFYQTKIAKLFYRVWVKIDQPDLIICSFLWHGESAVFNKHRDIVIFHNPVSQIPYRYKFSRKFIDQNTSVVLNSNDSLIQFNNYLAGSNKSRVIYTGVDVKYFKPDRIKNKSKSLRLICISAFEQRKGIQYLLNSLPELLEKFKISLKIIGSGDYKKVYEELIYKLMINKFVKIYEPVDDTRKHLISSDIYCLLSIGEGFPLGLLEAMSCGIPVVTSQYPPFDEIDNKVIHRVKREDPNDIVTTIGKLSEKKYYSYISKLSRQYVENYHSWDGIAKKYFEVINENK